MLSLQRSLSVSSDSSSRTIGPTTKIPEENRTEPGEALAEFRSPFPADFIPAAPQLPWTQELLYSVSNRPSRASSLVSTRTRFSTTTVDDVYADARSIDLHVGGHYFRISKDGSRITDELPPPYTGPSSVYRLRSPDPPVSRSPSASMFRGGRSIGPSVSDNLYSEDDGETSEILTAFPRSSENVRANILDPSEFDMPSPVDAIAVETSAPTEDEAAEGEPPERNLSYKAGPEIISVLPQARERRSVSGNSNHPSSDSNIARLSSPLKRRNGVRLPFLVTESFDKRAASSSSRAPIMQTRKASTSPVTVRSAGPVLMSTHGTDVSASPTFIGRNADALFPRSARTSPEGLLHNVLDPATRPMPNAWSAELEEEHTTPPAMDSENDISLHYARIMRRLDRDHRKALHFKDKELEKMRERLNEVDTVYRQELRARDFMVEDLKKRLRHLQDTQETRIEKARNEVEDLWESRWKDRDFHLRERMRRMEEEAQRSHEQA